MVGRVDGYLPTVLQKWIGSQNMFDLPIPQPFTYPRVRALSLVLPAISSQVVDVLYLVIVHHPPFTYDQVSLFAS